MRRRLPILLTLVMLGGILFQEQAKPDAAELDRYHDGVRAAVEAIPEAVGDWHGEKVDAPEAAIKLLKPNVIFSRLYINGRTGRTATLTLVQCRDSRDMGGHYPPVCYPAHGYTEVGEPTVRGIQIAGVDVPAARYQFHRSAFASEQNIVVYGFFMLPGTGFATDMRAVRSAASDLRVRELGAGQVQVVMDAGIGVADEEAIVRDLVEPVLPALRVIGETDGGRSRE
jgi:hypothetical protein